MLNTRKLQGVDHDVAIVILLVIAHDWIMTTMWVVYLVNACYGWLKWTKMQKTDNAINA